MTSQERLQKVVENTRKEKEARFVKCWDRGSHQTLQEQKEPQCHEPESRLGETEVYRKRGRPY